MARMRPRTGLHPRAPASPGPARRNRMVMELPSPTTTVGRLTLESPSRPLKRVTSSAGAVLPAPRDHLIIRLDKRVIMQKICPITILHNSQPISAPCTDIPEKNVQIPIRITSEQYCAITPEDAFTWKARIDAEVATSDGDDHVRRSRFPPLRVLIVDDDPRILTVFAKELDAQLTISVCATAAGGEHALDTPSWRSHHIDVILLDISMPGLNGIQTARAIHRNLPDLPIVMFTAFSDERTLSEALTEGVKGFITKDESVEGVATALIRAKKGMSTMSAHPIELLVSAYQSEQRRQRNAAQAQRKIMNLPPRLRNVHDFILKDLTNRQIARRSGISENTTRIYVSDLLHRLGYASREELMTASLLEAPKVPHTEKPICNITEAAES